MGFRGLGFSVWGLGFRGLGPLRSGGAGVQGLGIENPNKRNPRAESFGSMLYYSIVYSNENSLSIVQYEYSTV